MKLVTAKSAVWFDRKRIYLVMQGVLMGILPWGLNTDVKEGGMGQDSKVRNAEGHCPQPQQEEQPQPYEQPQPDA